jgi:signal transduction histidine kinase
MSSLFLDSFLRAKGERSRGSITRLTAVAEQVAGGDLTAQAHIESRDEIGKLARTFNSMISRLRETLEDLEQRNQQLYEEIAERKQAEEMLRQYVAELQARNDELAAFAHTVAHDLRGPLCAIVGFAQVLQADRGAFSEDERLEYLGAVAQSGRKMSDILDGLLALGGALHTEVVLEPFDMAAVVAEALERQAYMTDYSRAVVTVPESWPIALGHGPWVEEVWVNLLSNAIKYGGQPPRIELGSETVTNVLHHQLVDGPSSTTDRCTMIRFWIRDNGPGLTTEEQTLLFMPFSRVDDGRGSGDGLGLSIVRRIVERLGGEVGVESQVGEGSLFYFTLPALHGDGVQEEELVRRSTIAI